MSRRPLDSRLLAAHATGDTLSLVTLYREAAEHAQEDEARGFISPMPMSMRWKQAIT